MKYEVQEAHAQVSRRETWTTEIGGYSVIAVRNGTDPVCVSVYPSHWRHASLRLPLLQFYPKEVADLERLSDALPVILQTSAKELRAAGLDDLRSPRDKTQDGWEKYLHEINIVRYPRG